MDAFWIILAGILIATVSALIGSFLLLRKMTMLGDAIAHAVLPGLVIAYMFSGERSSFILLVGAAIFGIITTLLIETLHKKTHLQIDAAIGISFTWLFSLGVILITIFANQIDVEQDCVLYGEIAYIPLDTIILNSGTDLGPRHIWILGALLLLISLFLWLGYKGLFITTFDEQFAISVGISTVFWHYALMSAVSLTTVLSFEAVGAILVIAFLVGPPATAYLISKELKKMIFLAVVFGISAVISGYYLAIWIDGTISGAMVAMIGVEFMIVLFYLEVKKLLLKKNLNQEMNLKQKISKSPKQVSTA